MAPHSTAPPVSITTAASSTNATRSVLLGVDFTRSTSSLSSALRGLDLSSTSATADYDDSECCGGGGPAGCCCMSSGVVSQSSTPQPPCLELSGAEVLAANPAFNSLKLPLSRIARSARLLGSPDLPAATVRLSEPESSESSVCDPRKQSRDISVPPAYMQPHFPYMIPNLPVLDARLLTSASAVKRTYHFDIDVTDYPEEIEGVDFRVGGAVGVSPPNDSAIVDEILTRLDICELERDKLQTLTTTCGRWPTIWGDDEPRKLQTTVRELFTWTIDLHNGVFTKSLLRVLAEYATDSTERSILLWLCSHQGQSTFCNLRSDKYPPTLLQLLLAFPSVEPPVGHLLSVLPTLMPRFYSLSSDPVSSTEATSDHPDHLIRKIEFAVTIHKASESWHDPPRQRTGVCTAFMEQLAQRCMAGESVTIPLFRGLQANPLAKEFRADGPMLLIGAGVGVAPFRGFVQRRLKNANCKNKVWVLQGCRDSLMDELYAGEWGIDDSDVRKVVQSRRGTKQYVQDEVIVQGSLVWDVISHPEGCIFVCGSSKGMGEGVEASLIAVAMEKGAMSDDQAKEFWKEKARTWQYVTETW
ncbi:uncharacterized protein V1518DRAFT_418186 [Limtongia smithiae]|uniref:uncharacterized protein n=1 Tax=Limtongia smithiae TaxID=1125753 RepID=UPI0034CEAA31